MSNSEVVFQFTHHKETDFIHVNTNHKHNTKLLFKNIVCKYFSKN